MTYKGLKSREDLTGCTCGSKEPLVLNSPVTGFTCPDCGATKDRLKKLEKAFAAAKEYIDCVRESENDEKFEAYEAAVRELEE